MARKICTVCNARPQYTGGGDDPAPSGSKMCNPCYTEGGWENTHSDEGHEDGGNLHEPCWICVPELNLAQKPYIKKETKGHHSPRRPQINHRACQHAQTPKARRDCRTAFWAAKATAEKG